jgi:hypothetical protein
MGCSWRLGRNKLLRDARRNFAADLHAFLVGGVRVDSGGAAGGARPAAAKATPVIR